MVFSITVSFITMSTGTKHVLDGFVKSWRAKAASPVDASSYVPMWMQDLARLPIPTNARRGVLYTSLFATVFLFAASNPEGFINVMEKVTSLALNLESGVFIVLMYGTARQMTENIYVPWALPSWSFPLRWVVMIYFIYAVLYDIVLIVFSDILGWSED